MGLSVSPKPSGQQDVVHLKLGKVTDSSNAVRYAARTTHQSSLSMAPVQNFSLRRSPGPSISELELLKLTADARDLRKTILEDQNCARTRFYSESPQ